MSRSVRLAWSLTIALLIVGVAVLLWRGRDARRVADDARRQAQSVDANARVLGTQLDGLRRRVADEVARADAIEQQSAALVAARRAVTDAFRLYTREAVATTNAQTARIAALNRAVDAANAGDTATKTQLLAGEVAQAAQRADAALARQQRAESRLEAALTRLGAVTS